MTQPIPKIPRLLLGFLLIGLGLVPFLNSTVGILSPAQSIGAADFQLGLGLALIALGLVVVLHGKERVIKSSENGQGAPR